MNYRRLDQPECGTDPVCRYVARPRTSLGLVWLNRFELELRARGLAPSLQLGDATEIHDEAGDIVRRPGAERSVREHSGGALRGIGA